MGSILGSRQKSTQQQESQGSGSSQSVQKSTSTGQSTSSSVQGSQSTGSSFQQAANESTSQGTSGSRSVSSGVSTSTGRSSSSTTSGMTADQVLAKFSDMQRSTAGWSKEAAIADVQGVLRQQATDALQSVMPSIGKVDAGAGAYNSTTKQLMRNDAEARISGQLATTALNAITQYGNIGNQTATANNQALSALAQVSGATGQSSSTSTTDASSLQSGVSSSESQQTSGSSGFSIGGSSQNSTSFGSSNAQSTQQSDSLGVSTSEYDQSSTGSGSSKGGGGLLGLFADGGQVPEPNDMFNKILDMTGINNAKMNAMDMAESMKKMGQGELMEGLKGFMSEQEAKELAAIQGFVHGLNKKTDTAATGVKAFADGGIVGEQMKPPALPTFVFNIGNGAPPATESDNAGEMQAVAEAVSNEGGAEAAAGASDGAMLAELASLFFADGGQVPQSSDPEKDLLEAFHKYKQTGQARSGASDAAAGGKIRGKQSPTGEDNQVIAVAGGEGIIPKDVMEVQGVPELLRGLIQKYHTPVNGGQK